MKTSLDYVQLSTLLLGLILGSQLKASILVGLVAGVLLDRLLSVLGQLTQVSWHRHPKNLMIVAHPDDEFIFGGEALLREPHDWYVLVLSHGKPDGRRIRQQEFAASMAAMGLPETNHEMLDFPDGKDRLDWDEGRLRGYVQSLIDYFGSTVVASHNAAGEYGHPQHMMVHRILQDKLTHVFSLEARDDWSDRRARLYDVLYRSQHQAMIRLRDDARRCDIVAL